MSVRFQIAAMVYLMVQAVAFGVGVVTILSTPLSAHANVLIPLVTITTAIVSAPLAWMIAPRLRLRWWRRRPGGDALSGPSAP